MSPVSRGRQGKKNKKSTRRPALPDLFGTQVDGALRGAAALDVVIDDTGQTRSASELKLAGARRAMKQEEFRQF